MRMGKPKALLAFQGMTFIEKIISDYKELECHPIVVVTGQHTNQIREVIDTKNVKNVVNDHPERGPFSSLKVGLSVLTRACAGFFLAPVDHPAVKVTTLRSMLEAWEKNPDMALKPTFKERGGHPVLMGEEWITSIQYSPDSSNLRDLMRDKSRKVVTLSVSDPGVLMNVDTNNDYQKLLKYQAV